jgi:hypothetical protein
MTILEEEPPRGVQIVTSTGESSREGWRSAVPE